MVASFDVALNGNSFPNNIGWPILPHGGGAFFNVYGRYIGGFPQNGVGPSYASHMAFDGEIIGASINYTTRYGSQLRCNIANFGPITPNLPIFSFTIPAAIAPLPVVYTSQDSIIGQSIPFQTGDFIGMYITDQQAQAQAPPEIIIEGNYTYKSLI